jgi:hypothetical protein
MPFRSYLPTLQIAGDEVALTGFSFSAAASDLGVKAEISLADPNQEITKGDLLTLTLRLNTGSQPKSRLIKNGFVSGSNKTIAAKRLAGLTAPDDKLSISALDQIGYKWHLAPRIPQILYDPAFVDLEENELDSNVNDADGNRIYAEATAVNSLDLDFILNWVYVEQLGFSEVIHNLPNVPPYKIPRADFPLSASYHSIASSFFALFKPLVFEDDSRLFLIDAFGEIPAGLLTGARLVEADGYITYQKQNPETPIVNAVLLTHKEISFQGNGMDEFPESVTYREEADTRNVGTPFTAGWIRTIFTRFIAEIHDDEEDLAKITSEIVYKTETRTSGLDEEGTQRDFSVELQEDRYSNSWRLKLGYTKTVEAYLDDGDGGKSMQQAMTEINQLIWKPSIVNPGEYEKHYSTTLVEGLVLIEGEGEDEVKTPLMEASRNGDVPTDSSATIERMPISSSIEVWRYTGADQIEIHVQKIDQLTKRVETTKTVSHIGTNAARVRQGASFNTKQVLLLDPDSDLADGPREPITYDAGFAIYAIALELALRALREARTPRPKVSCKLASFDGGLRRGSIRLIADRDGVETLVMVTGYSVNGAASAHGQILISQTIEGVVLPMAA